MRERLSRKAEGRAVNVLLWYPDNRHEYASYLGGSQIEPGRVELLKLEIDAVEEAMDLLAPGEDVVIQRRYFETGGGDGRKPVPFERLGDLPFDRTTMQRIAWRMVRLVAYFLGETVD